ncbi:phosphoprotein [Tailam virus]|uniref:Phosphoprotein n=1 Tax=Tailam virus TaxID=1117633 RepID=G9IRZ5_9MONO|nr:phosphoprotein [Tailam virus]AEU08856.1 phosphoprotein [Tailam virus]
MSDYTPEALQQLVKNGIKTIELLQQSPEDFQKTYGRSAIQEPTTRARVQAWESLNTNHDNTSNQDQRNQGVKEGTNTSESKGAPSADGRYGNQSKSDRDDSATGIQRADQPLWDAPYNDGDSSRNRGDTAGGLPTIGEGSNTFQSGDQEFEGYHPDGPVNAGEYSQISAMDHEMSAAEMYGSTTQLTSMRNATTDDFAKVFEEGTPKVHRRLRGITAVVPAPKQIGAVGGPVKKGTDENTASTLLGDVQLSGSGAIHNVHPSLLLQPKKNAHAENAQGSVQDVSTTGAIGQSNEAAFSNQEVEGKLNLVLKELDSISKKLDYLPEIKEEIKNINKKITNLSLGLSTVESYIKSMMIVIPGSGKTDGQEPPEVNPDLRAVIGRDKTRGLKEVTMQRSDLESLELPSPPRDEIDPKYLTRDLDFEKSNAANFVPTDDPSSFYTIVAMIKDEVTEMRRQQDLIKWVSESMAKYPLSQIYKIVREMLDADEEESDSSDSE